jgi:hypothetical protein
LAAEKIGPDLEIIFADCDAVLQTEQLLGYIQEPGQRPNATERHGFRTTDSLIRKKLQRSVAHSFSRK